MKVAVFSDIHGNLEALISILNDIKKEKVDEIICLGDVIGIGPNSSECIDLLIDNDVRNVLGNHDLYFLKGTDIDDEMTIDRKKHYEWVTNQIGIKEKEYLEKCVMKIEKEFNGKKILFEHFLIDYNSKDQYPFYGLDIIDNGEIHNIISNLDYDLILIGHEHDKFSIDNKLIDIGSSGCVKDDTTFYTVLDTDTLKLDTKYIKFDRTSFEKKVIDSDYPYKDRLVKEFFGMEI